MGRATVVSLPEEETNRRWAETTPQWPIMHAVLHGVTRDQFMGRHHANHINVAYAPAAAEADRALAAKAAMFDELGVAVICAGEWSWSEVGQASRPAFFHECGRQEEEDDEMISWESLKTTIGRMSRAKVPGGWFVTVETVGRASQRVLLPRPRIQVGRELPGMNSKTRYGHLWAPCTTLRINSRSSDTR